MNLIPRENELNRQKWKQQNKTQSVMSRINPLTVWQG